MSGQLLDSERNAEAPPDALTERRRICEGCEHKLPIGICSQCGCIILLKTKWKGQKCPLGKWGPQG